MHLSLCFVLPYFLCISPHGSHIQPIMELCNGFSISSLTFQITNQLFNVLLNTELVFIKKSPTSLHILCCILYNKFEVIENFIKNQCNCYVAEATLKSLCQ